MTHEELAREILKHWNVLEKDIAEALRTVELEALERAAKVADSHRNNVNVPAAMAVDDAANLIAQQIRSLKEQTQAEDSEGVR